MGKKPLGSDKHFVFLQGMPSPFFSRIGENLAARGCRVTGINLCVGDWLFWRGPNKVNYRGTLGGWPDFFRHFCQAQGVTDLVLLGEQRRYHKQAVAVAKELGLRVTVTDFGYLRPDWITLEREGMSGNSLFPRDPQAIRMLATNLPSPDLAPRYADSSANMARGDLLYSFSNVFLGWLYPFYQQSDNRPHPLVYFPMIGWRLLRTGSARGQAQKQTQRILLDKTPFFVFPLQLEHDFQIVAYSDFKRLADAIRLVLDSFARHSAPETRLIVKIHPWDPGLKNWRKLISRWSRMLGVEERVEYLDGGSLDDLVRRSAGMVTVNSTSGVRAIQLGCPVQTLGKAIYDVPGLTFQHGLDRFWAEATAPEPELAQAFIKAMAGLIQIRGVFFDEPGLSTAVNVATEKLYRSTVGQFG